MKSSALLSVVPRLLTASLLLAMGCDKAEPAPKAPEAPTAQTPATDPGAAKAPEAPKAAPAAIAEADLKALLDGWTDAQNRGDLEAYTALYATRFTGVKKVGDRASSFDRDGWIKDRGRMFKKAMKVEASQVQISAGAQSAVISFEQTWESGNYRDVGPKQLIVVREGDALKIAREELLSSSIEGARQQVSSLSSAQFGYVLHESDHMAFILEPRVNPDEQEHDAPVSLKRGFAAWAKLKAQEAPLALELFGPAGKVCDATAKEYGLFSYATVHFGQLQAWDGTFEEGLPRLTDAQVAEGLMQIAGAEGTHRSVRVDASACEGAVWGRVKQPAPAATYAAVDTAPLEPRAQAELRKLASWKAIQRDFEQDTADRMAADGAGKWDEQDATRRFAAWQAPDGKTLYVAYSVRAGSGCGAFEGETWALWRVLGGDAWTLITDPKSPGPLAAPTSAADLDGDGQPEFMAPDTLIQPAGTVWRVTGEVRAPYYDCPC
jgi:ketosteroid isomerase-like protein